MTAPLTHDIELSRIGTLAGNYELVDLIGVGGMGAVYRGIDRRSGGEAAIKVLSRHATDAGTLARFYQEARIHQSLDHTHVARCLELVDAAGTPALAMEYLGGASMSDLLASHGRLDPAQVLHVIAALGRALAHLHAHGVIHRDIKPSNIRTSASGVVKLLDFGIAKTRTGLRGLTNPNHVIGTPAYLAPEQLLGEPATTASDVWSVGVVVYELATGRLPFQGDAPAELRRHMAAGCVILPSGLVDQRESDRVLWIAIDRIAAACLEPDRRLRRITPAALVVEAEEALRQAQTTGGAAPARLATTRSRWPRWPRPVLLAVAVSLLLVILRVLGSDTSANDPARIVHHIDVVSGRATVYVNGRRLGRTPVDYVGHTGDVIDVDLEQTGFAPAHEQIQLGVDATSTFSMQSLPARGERP